MFEVTIGGTSRSASVTFYTMQLYESEFGTDMLKDLFGQQDEDSEPIKWKGEGDEATIESIDFTKVGWGVLTKVLWAALKTEDGKLPGYKAWSRDASGVNLWEVRAKIDAAVNDCCFRPPAEGEEAE